MNTHIAWLEYIRTIHDEIDPTELLDIAHRSFHVQDSVIVTCSLVHNRLLPFFFFRYPYNIRQDPAGLIRSLAIFLTLLLTLYLINSVYYITFYVLL